jgi:hypothetical protein
MCSFRHKLLIALKWILFVFESIFGVIGIWVFCFWTFRSSFDRDSLILLCILLPVSFHISCITNNLAVFPLSYSVMGCKKRTRAPKEEIIYEVVSWNRDIECHYWPTIKWSFYPTGVEVNFIPLGRAFIRWDSVTSIETNKRGCCVLYHNSPELRYPLNIPIKLAELNSLGLYKPN